ncbi:MAG: hypothetical protein ABI548_28935 [Polyangiaceae bacterium]|jgi:hypothetical protein
MSILDLTDQLAWYAVRVTAQHYGSKGYIGVQYQWSKPKYLSNMDALGYAFDLAPNATTKAGVQTFYESELYQWDGRRWQRIPP